MAQQFLYGANVIAGFEKVGREGVPKRVAGGPLRNPGLSGRVAHRLLDRAFVNVVAVVPAILAVEVIPCSWKQIGRAHV